MGGRLRTLRLRRRYTLDDLCEITGVNKMVLSNIENGLAPKPTLDSMYRIAQALGTTIDYIVGAEEEISADNRAYFREYLGLPEETKKTVRQMTEIIKR